MTWDEAATFDLPNLACETLDFSTLRDRATAAGVQWSTFEYSRMRRRPGYTHITTRVAMAAFMAEQLRALALKAAARHETDKLIACTHGIAEVMKELDAHAARKKSQSDSDHFHDDV